MDRNVGFSPARAVITVRELRKWYPGRSSLLKGRGEPVKAVDGVSFSVGEGEVLGLVGGSGSGKSTTGALLMGLEAPTAGEIHFQGLGTIRPDEPRTRREFTRLAQLVFQNPYEALNPRHTVAESILEPVQVHFPNEPERQQALLIKAMERAGLVPYIELCFPLSSRAVGWPVAARRHRARHRGRTEIPGCG